MPRLETTVKMKTPPKTQEQSIVTQISKILRRTAIRAQVTDTATHGPASHASASATRTVANVPTERPTCVSGVPSANHGQSGATVEPRTAPPAPPTAMLTIFKYKPEQVKCLTHGHYCKHCNRSFICHASPCLIPGDTIKLGKDKPKFPNYDISKIHPCDEGKKARKLMALILGDRPKCLYNCDKPCNHNFPISENDETSVSIHTSSYSIDGITNKKEASKVKNAWYKAKQERVSDKFQDVPWLATIAKEFRQR